MPRIAVLAIFLFLSSSLFLILANQSFGAVDDQPIQVGGAISDSLHVVFLDPDPAIIYQFEKIELGIKLPELIENKIREFRTPPFSKGGINPYNPDIIDLSADFTSESGKAYHVNGFYYCDFERANCTPMAYPCWIEKAVGYSWRIRFAPPEPGNWKFRCQLKVRVGEEFLQFGSRMLQFNCFESGKGGYISRKGCGMIFSKSGEPFIPLGLNTDWYRWGIVNNSISEHYSEYFNEIHRNGGNAASLALINFTGLQFEWEYSGIYENPDVLNNSFDYNGNRQAQAWEIDKILELAEQKDIYLKFTLLQHADFGDDSWNWPGNPYHRFIQSVKEPIDFFTNDSACLVFSHKLRYIAARWGYSSHISSYELFTEIDNTRDFSSNQKAMYHWFNSMARKLKEYDNYQHLISGSYASYMKDNNCKWWVWRSPYCDLINLHAYGQNKRTNYDRYSDLKKLRRKIPGKPALFGEMGSYVSPEIENITDLQFHNNLWATYMMGNTGAGLNWFWETMLPNGYSHNLKPLHDFSSQVDFTKKWIPRRFPLFHGLTLRGKNYRVENFYLNEKNKKHSVGWIHNATVYWFNRGLPELFNSEGKIISSGDDDKYVAPVVYDKDFARISGLKAWRSYCFTAFLIRNDNLERLEPVTIFSNIAGQVDITTRKYFHLADDFAYTLKIGKCPCSATTLPNQH
ncbi:MAG: DUF5060 domain-containing protein [Bacteroidetes bacterium]|nr:DUF5060 domain-containing protein [Bacteroidota bacterium]